MVVRAYRRPISAHSTILKILYIKSLEVAVILSGSEDVECVTLDTWLQRCKMMSSNVNDVLRTIKVTCLQYVPLSWSQLFCMGEMRGI